MLLLIPLLKHPYWSENTVLLLQPVVQQVSKSHVCLVINPKKTQRTLVWHGSPKFCHGLPFAFSKSTQETHILVTRLLLCLMPKTLERLQHAVHFCNLDDHYNNFNKNMAADFIHDLYKPAGWLAGPIIHWGITSNLSGKSPLEKSMLTPFCK